MAAAGGPGMPPGFTGILGLAAGGGAAGQSAPSVVLAWASNPMLVKEAVIQLRQQFEEDASERPAWTYPDDAAAAGIGVQEGPNYYRVLEVERGGDDAAIKKSYRKLVLQWHPDKHPANREEADEKIRAINAAYETLGNPVKRAGYDQMLEAVERKKRGARLDTSFIKPRMSIPKEFFLCPLGHPDKFVRAVGSELLVQSREDVSLNFHEFFGAAKFTLWWLPEVNNMCRIRTAESAQAGVEGGNVLNFLMEGTPTGRKSEPQKDADTTAAWARKTTPEEKVPPRIKDSDGTVWLPGGHVIAHDPIACHYCKDGYGLIANFVQVYDYGGAPAFSRSARSSRTSALLTKAMCGEHRQTLVNRILDPTIPCHMTEAQGATKFEDESAIQFRSDAPVRSRDDWEPAVEVMQLLDPPAPPPAALPSLGDAFGEVLAAGWKLAVVELTAKKAANATSYNAEDSGGTSGDLGDRACEKCEAKTELNSNRYSAAAKACTSTAMWRARAEISRKLLDPSRCQREQEDEAKPKPDVDSYNVEKGSQWEAQGIHGERGPLSEEDQKKTETRYQKYAITRSRKFSPFTLLGSNGRPTWPLRPDFANMVLRGTQGKIRVQIWRAGNRLADCAHVSLVSFVSQGTCI
ncbi:unnamed protein product [Prorocentrum cordatum]|uniref:J domain-containing protein n=1 Tax=Prorocentrum cordatum TaxID=2364126 RepID=A0ABN9V021_9DINO|nr:unnamed protein product [Polarella glacialis]